KGALDPRDCCRAKVFTQPCPQNPSDSRVSRRCKHSKLAMLLKLSPKQMIFESAEMPSAPLRIRYLRQGLSSGFLKVNRTRQLIYIAVAQLCLLMPVSLARNLNS